jgi:hypothetical protein
VTEHAGLTSSTTKITSRGESRDVRSGPTSICHSGKHRLAPFRPSKLSDGGRSRCHDEIPVWTAGGTSNDAGTLNGAPGRPARSHALASRSSTVGIRVSCPDGQNAMALRRRSDCPPHAHMSHHERHRRRPPPARSSQLPPNSNFWEDFRRCCAAKSLILLARSERFELPTLRFEV